MSRHSEYVYIMLCSYRLVRVNIRRVYASLYMYVYTQVKLFYRGKQHVQYMYLHTCNSVSKAKGGCNGTSV